MAKDKFVFRAEPITEMPENAAKELDFRLRIDRDGDLCLDVKLRSGQWDNDDDLIAYISHDTGKLCIASALDDSFGLPLDRDDRIVTEDA